jgi:hypothetical protein
MLEEWLRDTVKIWRKILFEFTSIAGPAGVFLIVMGIVIPGLKFDPEVSGKSVPTLWFTISTTVTGWVWCFSSESDDQI